MPTQRQLWITWCVHTAQHAGLCLQWRSGRFSGLGMERFADGTLFVGEYEDGLADGSGVAIYLDGSMHEGHFAAGAAAEPGRACWLVRAHAADTALQVLITLLGCKQRSC